MILNLTDIWTKLKTKIHICKLFPLFIKFCREVCIKTKHEEKDWFFLNQRDRENDREVNILSRVYWTSAELLGRPTKPLNHIAKSSCGSGPSENTHKKKYIYIISIMVMLFIILSIIIIFCIFSYLFFLAVFHFFWYVWMLQVDQNGFAGVILFICRMVVVTSQWYW